MSSLTPSESHHSDTPMRKSSLIYYALMGFPLAMLGIPVYLYLPQYYADEFALSLSAIGLALLAARLFDVITDPLIGWFSDRYSESFSRQKQVFTGLVLLLFSLYALFFPLVDTLNFTYVFVTSFITYLAWTLVQVPYQTMVAEISHHPIHKTQLTSAREAMAIFGVLFILITPFGIGLQTNEPAFYEFFIISVFISLVLAGLVLFKIDWLKPNHLNLTPSSANTEDVTTNAVTSKESIFTLTKQLWLEHRIVFSVMPAYFLNNLANALPATLFVFFVSDYLQLAEYTGLFLLMYFLSGLVALPFWIALSKGIGKEKTWQLSMVLASLFFSLAFLLEPSSNNNNSLIMFSVITVLTGFSLGIDLAIPASIQADITQEVNHTSEVKGFIFGIWGLLTKLALAVAVGLSLPALDFLKASPEFFESGILWLYAGIPILLKVLSVLLVNPKPEKH